VRTRWAHLRRISGSEPRHKTLPTSVQLPPSQIFAPGERVGTRWSTPEETSSSGSAEQGPGAAARVKTTRDDERGCVEEHVLVGRKLGGGSGTLSMAMRGCLRGAIGTAPMRKRPAGGQTWHETRGQRACPSAPPHDATSVKGHGHGAQEDPEMMTIPVIQRRRIRPIISLLSDKRYEGLSRVLTLRRLCSRYFERILGHLDNPATRRQVIPVTRGRRAYYHRERLRCASVMMG
jgi:hypothetical protein